MKIAHSLSNFKPHVKLFKAMAFKFNFCNPSEQNKSESSQITSKVKLQENEELSSGKIQDIELAQISERYLKAVEEKCSILRFGSFAVKYVPSSVAFTYKTLLNCDTVLQLCEDAHSDLLPGIYEGGFKLWECAIDLTSFLHEKKCFWAKANVLELGCGAGIPGILAYLHDCQVTFQDFNQDVLQMVTIPNVILNTCENKKGDIPQFCHFVAGDWSDIRKSYENGISDIRKFDIIVTSETIYAKENHKKLLELMKCILKPTGVVYLAAKTHYFGVGGSLDDFESEVIADNTFKWNVVHRISDGVQRCIIQMNFNEAE